MMSLEEAIKHCEEVAEENEGMCRVEEAMGLGLQNAEMMKCANKHRQLAEWLRELKAYRDGCKCEDCIHSETAHDEYPCYLCVGSELWKFKGGAE